MQAQRKRRGLYVVRLTIFAVPAFILILWGIGAYQGYVSVNELLYPIRALPCCGTPGDAGYNYKDVTLITDDGLNLSGWYLPAENNTAIIMAHGAGANRMTLWELGRQFHDAGFGVLLFDLRAHGASGGSRFTQGWLDIEAAVAYLQAESVEKIGVYGFSLGANMTLQAAARLDAIDAVVADGASPVGLSDYRFPRTFTGLLYLPYDLVYWSRLEAVSRADGGFAAMSNHEAVRTIAPRPLLLIAAGAETSGFEVTIAESLAGAAQAQPDEATELWVIPDVYHGGGFAAHAEAYLTRVRGFFAAAWERVG